MYRRQYEHTCPVCKTKYQSRKNSKYCSGTCRNVVWRNENREKYRLKQQNWVEQNIERHRINQSTYQQTRCKTDILYKLKRRIRARLGRISFNNNIRTVEWLGCSIAELKVHLEKQFQEGMSWANYGKWHIDHIIPLASANSEEEVLKLSHYTNLQPLWAKDNLSKGDRQ